MFKLQIWADTNNRRPSYPGKISQSALQESGIRYPAIGPLSPQAGAKWTGVSIKLLKRSFRLLLYLNKSFTLLTGLGEPPARYPYSSHPRRNLYIPLKGNLISQRFQEHENYNHDTIHKSKSQHILKNSEKFQPSTAIRCLPSTLPLPTTSTLPPFPSYLHQCQQEASAPY